MPVLPPAGETPITYTVADIVRDAFIETGKWAPGEDVNERPDEAQWGFRKINYLLDEWAARRNFVYAQTFATYTLVPGTSPHLIGPDPTTATPGFVVPQRPVKVENATIVLNNVSPAVEIDLNIRDKDWWMREVSIKGLQTSQPTDLFYNPAFPNGELYFWPVPDTNYLARLELWALLQQFDSITDSIGGPNSDVGTLPPAYRNALMLSLAEQMLSGVNREKKILIPKMAARARKTVFGNNTKAPRMATRDSGLPGGDDDRRATNFNYRSRTFN
jgi:hypothetical protein